jgi:ribonuclease E
MPEGAGVIVRTAAEGASEEELARDVSRLAAQWEAIERKSKTASAPDLLYGEPDLTIRVIRDIFNEDFSKLVIASDGEWDIVDEYVRYVAPHLADRLERWQDDKDVFAAYRIDEQLAKALERKVWLPSGGSLVIDPTEAMTVIDVNTGKFTGQGGNLEQTVTRNNLEAAEEIVRQLRVRDVGGIIVIDFIDMVLESNRELVLRRLLECLARDRTKHQVAEVTSLGLVQMTRKRVGSGLLEAFSTVCEHCNGRGVIISMEPVDHDHAPLRDDNRGRDDGKSRNGRGSRNGKSRSDHGRDDSKSSQNDRGRASHDGDTSHNGRGDDHRPAQPDVPAEVAASSDTSQRDADQRQSGPAVVAAATVAVSPVQSTPKRGRATRSAGPPELSPEAGPVATVPASENGSAPPSPAATEPAAPAENGASDADAEPNASSEPAGDSEAAAASAAPARRRRSRRPESKAAASAPAEG